MIHMSKIASKYFDYAEVIERHHETKIDAPSGTALATAEDMVKAKGKPFKLSVTEKVNLAGVPRRGNRWSCRAQSEATGLGGAPRSDFRGAWARL